jgi:hypothetical protein
LPIAAIQNFKASKALAPFTISLFILLSPWGLTAEQERGNQFPIRLARSDKLLVALRVVALMAKFNLLDAFQKVDELLQKPFFFHVLPPLFSYL